MLNRAEEVLSKIPLEECCEYYKYFTEDCCLRDREFYRKHLMSKLRDSFRHHRYKGKVSEAMTFRCYNMISWLNFMVEKYNLEERLSFKINKEGKQNVKN